MDPYMTDAGFETMTDEELVAAFRAGQGTAFRLLIKRYQKPLFNYLFRLLGSRDDSDDAFQETFLRAYRALPRFETGRRFKPWIYTIASNLVKNIYRSRSVRKQLSLDREFGGSGDGRKDNLASLLAAAGPGPEELADADERAAIVRQAVEELPPKGKQALVLFYFEGMSYEDIAEIVQVPLGTVKSRIHNATAQLFQKLGSLKESLNTDGTV
jgi:RNA polymerase sigma-70 factor, ECF subfamily